MEVCPLSREVLLQPLSVVLHDGLRFLHPPLPAPLSAFLTVGFPLQEGYGLIMFRLGNNDNGLGALSSPVAFGAHDREGKNPCTRYMPFGARLSAFLACCLSRRLSRVRLRSPYHRR